jgi:hypothetical protein
LNVRPLPGNIFAQLEVGERVTASGIVLRDDNGKDHGIRPRWGRVWQVAEDIDYIKPGQWILCEHGRWTMTIEVRQEDGSVLKFQKIDPNGIMAVQDEAPTDTIIGESFDLGGSTHTAEDFGAR